MDCLDDDWIDNEVDDRGLLKVLDGLNDGLMSYSGTWIALMAVGLIAMLTIVDC